EDGELARRRERVEDRERADGLRPLQAHMVRQHTDRREEIVPCRAPVEEIDDEQVADHDAREPEGAAIEGEVELAEDRGPGAARPSLSAEGRQVVFGLAWRAHRAWIESTNTIFDRPLPRITTPRLRARARPCTLAGMLDARERRALTLSTFVASCLCFAP